MKEHYSMSKFGFFFSMLLLVFCGNVASANNIELCYDNYPSEIITYESNYALPTCNTSPVITCPSNYYGCPGDNINPSMTGVATAIPGDAACPQPLVSFEDIEMTVGPCDGQLFVKRKWTATYPSGANPWLIADCTQIIFLEDNDAPVIMNCPADISVSSSTSCDVMATWTVPTPDDNCELVSFTSTHNSGDAFPDGETTVTYTATDGCGNVSTCSFLVIADGTCCYDPPSIACPQDINVCPSSSISPSITGFATGTPGGDECPNPTITYSDVVVSTGTCIGQVIERTWTATDPNNATFTTSCTQTITQNDSHDPVITNCPANVSVSSSTSCDVIATWIEPTATDNCELTSLTSTHNSGDAFPDGQTTVTYTATDACGNTTTCSFIVIADGTCCVDPPSITCPQNVTLCPGSSIDPMITGTATGAAGSSECPNPTVTYNDVVVSTGTCGSQVIERTWTATDPNTPTFNASCTQTITLSDNEVPVIANCPANLTVSSSTSCDVVATWNAPTATDNCSLSSLTSTHNSGDTFPDGQTTVTYTATDACGNTTTCSFIVTAIGTCCVNPPSISCPTDVFACPGSSIDPGVTGVAIATPSSITCDEPLVTYTDLVLSTGTCGDQIIKRIWTATDPNDATLTSFCYQFISLSDTQNPIISKCPLDITTSSNANCEGVAIWNDPITVDNCGVASFTSTHNSGDIFPIGTTTVTYTSTDNCGNSASCSFDVTITDNCCDTPPVIVCPTSHNGCVSTSTHPAITGMATATAGSPGCGTPVVTYTDIIESIGPCAGATEIIRTWTATDPNNSSLQVSCTQSITLSDDVAPVLTACPSDITVNNGTTATWTAPTATDNCSADNADDCSNCIQTVRVHLTDPTAPPIVTEVYVDGTILSLPNYPYNLTDPAQALLFLTDCLALGYTVEETLAPDNSYVDISVFYPGQTFNSFNINGGTEYYFTCTDCIGGNVVITSDYESGSSFPVGTTTVTYTATDGCGNSDTCDFTVTVNSPISIVCPANIAQNCEGLTGTVVTWPTPTTSGSCNVTSISSTHQSGDLFTVGVTTVTYTATDDCGNTVTCSFTVTIADNCCNVAPNITCPSDYYGCINTSTDPATTGTATAIAGSTSCGLPIVTYVDETVTSGPCAGAIKIKRTWTATDPNHSNLTTSCVQFIDLKDTVAPTLSECPANISVVNGTPANWTTPTATDNCDSTPTITGSATSGSVFPVGVTTVTYTAVDDCGNQSTTCTFTVTVIDPINVVCPANMTIDCEDPNGTVVTWTSPTTTGSCNVVNLTSTHASGSTFTVGTTTVTYTATDDCGYTSTCSFTVTVANNCCNVAPVIACPNYTFACIGTSIDPSITGSPVVTAGSSSCSTPIVTYADHILEQGPCVGRLKIERTWTATDPNDPTLTASCIQVIDLKDEIPPVIVNCPTDIEVDEGVAVSWITPTVTDNCDSTPTLTSNFSAGDIFPVGVTTVVYTATDNCGTSSTCSFTVTVIPTISLECPDNIEVDCNGPNGTVVHWTAPTFTTDCGNCENGVQIPGFIYMGDFNGHSYYCSTTNATWNNANAVCAMNGGHLAVINSPEENAFLANQLTIQSAYIGLSDAQDEGNFTWTNGDPLTYTNWYTGQPNNYNGDQNYVEMLNSGQWNDQYTSSSLEYIMELPCSSLVQTTGLSSGSSFPIGTTTITYVATDACGESVTCSFDVTVNSAITIDCPADVTLQGPFNGTGVNATWQTPQATSCCSGSCNSGGYIPGFIYMGEYNDHHYYCSEYPATWPNANQFCQESGGNLAAIGSQGENTFLTNQLTIQSAFIGLNDVENEGTFTWTNGEAFGYSNWYPGQPNDYSANQDYVELLSDGLWNDQYNNKALEFIMELPGCVNVSQTGGPVSGSHFLNGSTTTITYLATDECGNSTECSFDITVEETECNSNGNSDDVWIEHIGFCGISNTSGNNGGYADFSTICTNVAPNQTCSINLVPGYTETCAVYWKVWIDWNMDGDFTDSGEYIAYGTGSTGLTGTILTPYNLWQGTATMRVAMSKNGYANGPCEAYELGETEDYCINVIGGDLQSDETPTYSRDNHEATQLAAVAKEVGVRIYPNPVASTFRISTENILTEEITSLQLINANGAVAKSIRTSQIEEAIEITDVPSGIYILQTVLRDGTMINKKIVVQK